MEGVYVACPDLRSLYDLLVWVDCDPAERLRRGVARDGEAMRPVWTEVWMPEEDAYRRLCRPHGYAGVVVTTSTGRSAC